MLPDRTAQIVADRDRNTSGAFLGPLPPPSLLAGYDDVKPGLAERIVKMAETQAAHRQSMESRALDARLFASKAGMFCGVFVAVVVLATAGFFAYLGHPVSAAILGVGDLTALVAVFVTGQYAKKTGEAQRRLTLAKPASPTTLPAHPTPASELASSTSPSADRDNDLNPPEPQESPPAVPENGAR